jgi:hypothetical protein
VRREPDDSWISFRLNLFDLALESFERRVRPGADDPFTRYHAAILTGARAAIEPGLSRTGYIRLITTRVMSSAGRPKARRSAVTAS